MKEINYKITIAYDGTLYNGWQIQPNGISIQQKIQEALSIVLRHPTLITGSGRTDTGVHALGQVAHFKSPNEIEARRFLHSLNCILPIDIRIKTVEVVPEHFHARYSAKQKTYHYFLHTNPVLDPFQRLYAWHFFGEIHINNLLEAATYLVGTHDFSAFANESHTGAAAYNPIRHMKRLDIIPIEEGFRLEFEADGFLYKMVRNITGTLLEVASGRRSPASIPKIISSKDRKKAGKTAPPQGLFLVKVDY